MIWIDTQAPFDGAMKRVAAQPKVAVDTEADSLHSYFDKVCLIQISIPGEDLVIDPLRKIDLSAFGAILANERITKVLHGGDYDLRILNRDFGFTIANVIDTMICAQFLGYDAIGLAALLERYFAVTVDKTHQRADWAMRPLPRVMLEYAASDTRHLIELADTMRGELLEIGRWEWAQEEFARLATIRFSEREDNGEGFRRLKGINAFDRRSLAIVRALYDWRDEMARAADRPPFKIFGNDLILEVARAKAGTVEALNGIKGLSPAHRRRYEREILRRVREALALPEEMLPEKNEAKQWSRDKAVESRVSRLKDVRDKKAKELKLDPGVLAPRHVLTAIATIGDLDHIPAMREWQKRVLGEAFIQALGTRHPAL
ncbi:MAG TPA: ribonuclease D [Thermoanaerobaculia bacterium]